MATWQQLKEYIRSKYSVTEDSGDLLKLVFNTQYGRSQMVLVAHSVTGTDLEFATIASPFATVGSVELNAVLREVSEYVVGGAAIYGDLLMVRHAVPLASLDADDFESPLHLVIGAADAIEAKFVGSDAY